MKSIGSFLFILGAVASIFHYFGRVPIVLNWIDKWGETPAWVIKIGLMVMGAALYILGAKKKATDTSNSE